MQAISPQAVAREGRARFLEQYLPTCEHELKEVRLEGGTFLCVLCDCPLIKRRSGR